MRSLSSWPVVALLLLASCKEQPKPAPAPATSAKATPRFADFDDFVKTQNVDAGGAAPATAPVDVAATAIGTADGGAATATAATAPAPGAGPAIKLLEPGAEPRTAARYDFATETPQSTVATVRMSAQGGPPGSDQQPPLKLTLKLTPGPKAPNGAVKFALQVTKAEIVTGGMAVPPEAVQELKAAETAMMRVGGAFTASPRGTLSEVAIGGKGAPPELQELIGPLVELLFAPLPEEPIGVGAKWSLGGGASREGTQTSTFTLTARTDKTAEISIDGVRSAPPQKVPDPRAPPGVTMQLDGKTKTKMSVRFSGITSKVDGDTKTSMTIKDPSTTPPRTQTNVISVKHSLVAL
ncbi:MAG: hypothetical protein IPG50_12900 [Myxococcales bacterium]|nr:hypothetical protein [Myxococcales bacterium]